MLFSLFLLADEGPTFMEVSSRYSLIPSPPPPPFSSFPLKRSTVSPLERRLPWGSRENEICISRGCVLLAIRNAIIESNLPGITVARISDLTVIVRRRITSPDVPVNTNVDHRQDNDQRVDRKENG